uniref:MalT-like TPR region domain-containing protein n=1 Tax=Guillardia theta TaxID=55529 RepID=A0A7S4PQX4_GUITH
MLRQAIQFYHQALEKEPEDQKSIELRFNLGVAYDALASTLRDAGTRNAAEQIEEALSTSSSIYSEILQMDENHCEALNNWGAVLHSLAETRKRDEALVLLAEASNKLEIACSLSPGDFEASNNLADVLSSQAELLSKDVAGNVVLSPESESIWARAYKQFETSMTMMQYDYDRVNCLCNWANSLSRNAELKQTVGDKQGAFVLFQIAAAKLTEMVEKQHYEPDGYVVLAEAQKSATENAPDVQTQEVGYSAVCNSYREALKINGTHPEALAGLGETLLDVGRLFLQQGRSEEAMSALTSAGEFVSQFLQQKERDEVALYNMSCICSLVGREEECRMYLERCASVEYFNGSNMQKWATDLSADEDFAGMLSRPWLQELLQRAASGQDVRLQ